MQTKELQDIASQVRRDIVRMVHGCQSGHPGGSLGCTDVIVGLYFQQMKINNRKGKGGFLTFNMDATNEDLFFLSKLLAILKVSSVENLSKIIKYLKLLKYFFKDKTFKIKFLAFLDSFAIGVNIAISVFLFIPFFNFIITCISIQAFFVCCDVKIHFRQCK